MRKSEKQKAKHIVMHPGETVFPRGRVPNRRYDHMTEAGRAANRVVDGTTDTEGRGVTRMVRSGTYPQKPVGSVKKIRNNIRKEKNKK